MDVEKLIDHLKECGTYGFKQEECREAAEALATLQAENERLKSENIMHKSAVDDYYNTSEEYRQERNDLLEELEKVKAERDAAVADVCAIIGEVEEIRRGYGVDNADADEAFAGLCESYCAHNGHGCYKEGSDGYYCANFKWRGPQKED